MPAPAPVAVATAAPDNDDARRLAEAHLFGTAHGCRSGAVAATRASATAAASLSNAMDAGTHCSVLPHAGRC